MDGGVLLVPGSLPLPQGGREHGEHQRAGQGERRRVAGAGAEQAEGRRAEAVPGVVGEVPQRAGPGFRLLLNQQRERGVLQHAEAGAEQHHAREDRHRGGEPQQGGHAERGQRRARG